MFSLIPDNPNWDRRERSRYVSAISCLNLFESKLAQLVGTGVSGGLIYGVLPARLGLETMELTIRPKNALYNHNNGGEIFGSELTDVFTQLADFREDRSNKDTHNHGIYATWLSWSDVYWYFLTSCGQMDYRLVESGTGLVPLQDVMAQIKPINAMLKINASKLCRLTGVPKRASEGDGVTSEELMEALTE